MVHGRQTAKTTARNVRFDGFAVFNPRLLPAYLVLDKGIHRSNVPTGRLATRPLGQSTMLGSFERHEKG